MDNALTGQFSCTVLGRHTAGVKRMFTDIPFDHQFSLAFKFTFNEYLANELNLICVVEKQFT